MIASAGKTRPGALTTAILDVVRQSPDCAVRQILAALKPKGFNGHSIRTTVTWLVRTQALACDRSQHPARYRIPQASIAQRVLQALQSHGPQLSRELIARFDDLEPFSIRNALISLQEDGRVDRTGTRHQYRYFATGRATCPTVQLASVSGSLLSGSAPTKAEPAEAPRWPAPDAARLGPPMIGWRGLSPVELAA